MVIGGMMPHFFGSAFFAKVARPATCALTQLAKELTMWALTSESRLCTNSPPPPSDAPLTPGVPAPALAPALSLARASSEAGRTEPGGGSERSETS